MQLPLHISRNVLKKLPFYLGLGGILQAVNMRLMYYMLNSSLELTMLRLFVNTRH